MNRHFKDARYYLRRAAHTTVQGVREELEPVEVQVKRLMEDETVEAGRLDEIHESLQEALECSEREAKEAIATARERFTTYREGRTG